jgi:TatD family hydrolase
MTDSHAHLITPPISENFKGIISLFIENGGKYILDCSTDLESTFTLLKKKREYDAIAPGVVKVAIGLHPELFISSSPDFSDQSKTSNSITRPSYESTRKLISRYEECLKGNLNMINAVGETGLDYYWLFKDKEESGAIENANRLEEIEMEKMSFIRHVELAYEFNLPLTVHSREIKGETQCIEDALKIITQSGQGKVKGCMHSYTGSKNYIKDIIDLDFCIGFNQIVTYKSAEDVREIAKETPLEMILLETDCPFLPLRKPYAESGTNYGSPVDIKVIAQVIGEVKGISREDVIYQTDKNFERIFG